MTDAAFLPPSAPFDVSRRAQLDTALAGATPVQRAWLAGYLAGLDQAQAPAAAQAPAVAPVAASVAAPLMVLYASESGNAEGLAHRAAKQARKLGFKPRVVDLAEFDVARLPDEAHVLAIASTWGEGEPPGRAAPNYNALMADGAPRLNGLRFGVLALGDTSYAGFCATGQAIDARFEALGGTRVLPRLDCDLDYEESAAGWIAQALAALAPAPAAAHPTEVADADVAVRDAVAEVVDHVNLNSSRSAKQTIHVALGFEGAALAYEPGDSLELFPENDPALVDDVLAAAGLSSDDALRRTLLMERDITTLSATTVERFATAAGHVRVRKLVDSGEMRDWIGGRQLIDLLQTYPVTLTPAQLQDITRKLPPRAYSIASSRKEVGDEAHLLVSAVRYAAHGRERSGVASVHAADRLSTGAEVRVRLKPNTHFRLPDPATDIIMVGPGTGIAPFRAFVQERRAVEASGRSWLLFGEQRFTHDFLYQLEWQEALHDKSLTRMDLAFSRDQPEKIYVQDRLWQHRRDLVDWIEGGASLYVCGDAKAMARDVRQTMVRAYADVRGLPPDAAEATVAELERSRRYLQDVY